MPASWFLLALVVVADIAISLATLLVSPEATWGNTATLIALSTVSALMFIWITLSVARKPERFLQTATAFFGIDALLTLISLPILVWAQPELGDQAPVGPTLLLAVMLVWLIDVFGFILSRSLAVPYVAGVLLVIAYETALYQLSKPLLFGAS